MTECISKNSNVEPILPSDVTEVIKLIESSFLACVAPSWSGDAIRIFLSDDISEDKLLGFISEGNICLKYVDAGVITGAVVFSSTRKLAHFFVHPHYHKQGIAKKLFMGVKYLLSNEVDYIELMSTEYAVQAYLHLGFKVSASAFNYNGCVFQPMIYWMGNDRLDGKVEFIS